MFEQAF
jgi:type I restriction enzyme M protein